jgi:acetyl-CoA synthetase
MQKNQLRETDSLQRVRELLSLYSAPHASTAYLLCDRHDPAATAYTIVSPNLAAIELSYGVLREESERLAAAFASLGLSSGDRIATLMGKSRAYLVTLMAIWRLGAVHVPLFTAFAPAAITYRLNASGCRLVLCDETQRQKLAPGADMPGRPPWRIVTTGEADAGTMSYDKLLAQAGTGFSAAQLGGGAPVIEMYTSGTTGNPKAVVVPLRALASFHTYAEYGLGICADDVFWNAADPGWGYGLYFGAIATFATGVRSLLVAGRFSAETTYAVLSRYQVTNFASAPTVFRSLRLSDTKPPGGLKLRCVSSAGEPLTPEVNEWAVAALGMPVHDHYGQTETGMLINNHHHPTLLRPLRSGSMGHPLPGWTATILQSERNEPARPGELGRVAIDLSQSPLAWFGGYAGEPAKSAEKFSADGRWYITGDIGRMDESGYFYFAARDDDVIIMAGYRIGPCEIESILTAHPAVAECAVIAVPDQVRGEVLEAVVVLKPGQTPSKVLTAEIQEWVKSRYAAHAYPRRVHFATALPKTPSGKIQRFLLRQELSRELHPKEVVPCG